MTPEKWRIRRVVYGQRYDGSVAWLVIPPEGDRAFPFSGSHWSEVGAFAYGFFSFETASRALRGHLDRRRT